MTRRKQNQPQRLKSDDESEDDSAGLPKPASSGSPSETVANQNTRDNEEDIPSMDDSQPDEATDPLRNDKELSCKEEQENCPIKDTSHNQDSERLVNTIEKAQIDREQSPGVPSVSPKGHINEESEDEGSAVYGESKKDKMMDSLKDLCQEYKVNDKESKTYDAKDVPVDKYTKDGDTKDTKIELKDNMSNVCDENKNLELRTENTDINKLDERLNLGYNKDINKSLNSPSKLSHGHNQKDSSVRSQKKVKHSNSASDKKLKLDAESPISKLLSMVNNPEKIQSKNSYSSSFSLAASSSSHKIPPTQSVKRQSPSVTPSVSTSTSQLRSSKPLSGFLPPYSMYSQLQSMYATMQQFTNPHSSGEELNNENVSQVSRDIQPEKMSPVVSPSPVQFKKAERVKASPVPKPTDSGEDQPLDLSVKSKGLDLTLKGKSEIGLLAADHKGNSSGRLKNIPNSPSGNSSTDEVSSLKSLEEKFGGNPFKLDKSNRVPKPYIPYMHPMLPMYGGALYSPALFSTHPWMHTEKLPRSDISSRKTSASSSSTTINATMSHRSNSPSKSVTINHSSRETRSPPNTKSKNSPSILSGNGSSGKANSSIEKDNLYKKHTNLKCSCKKEFETLYQLTIHLKQTGHTPSTRISGSQDFPKLVRGQDMWLNHGSEQTKQILRCIRCGESFKSLPELTVHMMKTKHYANIVGADSSRLKIPPTHSLPSELVSELDIYKCFQCDKSFSGMEEFSKHMLTSGHHKSPIVIQPMSPGMMSPSSERTTPREYNSSREPSPKRMCRSLSESSPQVLDSSFSKYKTEYSDKDDENSWDSFAGEDNKIRCETCGDKIEMSKFVEHVRKCIRSNSWDYSTPLKKRRFDGKENTCTLSPSRTDDRTRVLSTETDTCFNGRNNPQSPNSVGSSSIDPLVKPTESSNDSSALKAMETFIERSFTPSKKEKHNFFGGFGSSISHSVFPMPYVNGHSPKSPSKNNSSPSHTSSLMNLYNKYLPPLYLPATVDKKTTKKSEINIKLEKGDNKDEHSSINNIPSPNFGQIGEALKAEMLTENNNKEILTSLKSQQKMNFERMSNHTSSESNDEHSQNRESATPSPSSLCEKYLNVDTEQNDKKRRRKDNSPNVYIQDSKIERLPNLSALASLQGLVYGKSYDSQHPLDNLQKLIDKKSDNEQAPVRTKAQDEINIQNGNTDRTFPNKLMNSNSNNIMQDDSSTFHSALKGSVVMSGLSSPVSGGGLSRPVSPCKSEYSTVASPAALSHTSETRVQTPDYSSENESNSTKASGIMSDGELEKSSDSPGVGGEYICGACTRSFASSGAYRYHTSRCHLSKAKKYQNSKENRSKTPYVYLPLDHSAKFNKYYEMANELANQSK